jgi:hypothetical protein
MKLVLYREIFILFIYFVIKLTKCKPPSITIITSQYGLEVSKFTKQQDIYFIYGQKHPDTFRLELNDDEYNCKRMFHPQVSNKYDIHSSDCTINLAYLTGIKGSIKEEKNNKEYIIEFSFATFNHSFKVRIVFPSLKRIKINNKKCVNKDSEFIDVFENINIKAKEERNATLRHFIETIAEMARDEQFMLCKEVCTININIR